MGNAWDELHGGQANQQRTQKRQNSASQPGQESRGKSSGNGFHRQCEWNDHGQPCQTEGHLSQSVVGGGPWYCRKHFGELMGWEDSDKPPTRGDDGFVSTPTVDEMRKRLKPRHLWPKSSGS